MHCKYTKFCTALYAVMKFQISSLAALSDGLWIQFSDNNLTFTGYLLRTGTYEVFPMYYAIIVNGIMGLICSVVCILSLVRVSYRPVWLVRKDLILSILFH